MTNSVPGPVTGLGPVDAISAGAAHALALLANGTIMAWGWNEFGQLGIGTATGPDSCSDQACSQSPIAVAFDPPLPSGVTVNAVSAGSRDSLALLSDGSAIAWGYNADGELGDGTLTGPDTCTDMSQSYACSPTPVSVEGISDAIAVSAGDGGNLALLADGSVMSWGNSVDVPAKVTFSPGLPSGVSVTAVAQGSDDGFALLSDTIVLAWGDNSLGQLGQGNRNAYSKPVAVTRLTDATAISANTDHTLALLGNGTVMASGSDEHKDLGSHAPSQRCQCVDHPVKVRGLHKVTAISAGDTHNLALISNGAVRGWGEGSDGELGSGVSETGRPKRIASLKGKSLRISAGSSFSLAFS